MILPISEVPLFTRTAPTVMTATMPRFSKRLITGLMSAMVLSPISILRSFSVRSSFTFLNRARS